ncbi:MAG: ShlB/FhaC/HecB family hemolysin secretion/activation protein [Alphaproteobacteria bacterium]|nr:ShlB/FhaC/HecB family hemolysin secretion/activation protein [Alphaproteobacteria bacterium]
MKPSVFCPVRPASGRPTANRRQLARAALAPALMVMAPMVVGHAAAADWPVAGSPPLLAQADAPLPPPAQSGRREGAAPPLPPIEPKPTAGAPAAPPAVPAPAGAVPLDRAPQFVLRSVRLDGNTTLDPAAVDAVVAPYLNKPTSLADLEEIRRRLTALYIENGYINSGVLVPDQNVSNGAVTMRAIEGRITDVTVSGADRFGADYFSSRLERALQTPFNVRDIETEQQILLQNPLIRRLNIELQPGLTPGEAKLNADVLENSPYSLSASVANDQSPTVGEIRGQLQGTAANLLGRGDILSAQYGRSKGLNDGYVSYSLPLLPDDTRLNLRYDRNGTVVIDPALSPLNITSDSQSISVGLSRPFYRTAEQILTLGLNGERRKAQTYLLGMPFAFTAGSDNGKTNITVLRFYQDWLDRNADHALNLRSTFSFGLNLFGTTITPVSPTSRFTAWLGQAEYVRRIFDDWEAVVRSDLQLSSAPLFPLEQFPLGGIDTVRGYREYLTVTDDVFFASGELRIPLGKVPLPYVTQGDEAGTVQVVPFYDFGRNWNVRRPTPYPPEISGIGGGFRWLPGGGIVAELYLAKALRHVVFGNSLEDRGIYFRLTTQLY